MPRLSTGQRLRTGLFIVIGILGVSTGVFFIVGESAFRTTNTYYISYQDVSVNGLLVGSDVRYNGISVGTVEEIGFAEDTIEEVIVTISIEADAPIKNNTRARLVPVGITGTRQIELFAGTNEAEDLESGSFIPAGTSTLDRLTLPAENIANDLQIVLGQLSAILRETDVQSLNRILNGVERIVLETEPVITRVVSNLDKLIASGQEPVNTVLAQISEAGANLAAASRSLERVAASVSDADLTAEVTSIFTELSQVLESTQTAVTTTVGGIEEVQGLVVSSGAEVERSLRLLRETLQYLNNFAMTISQDPSSVLR